MSNCCVTQNPNDLNNPSHSLICPKCHEKGKAVAIITLKSLLKPEAMKRLDSSVEYQFCRTAECSVVYFNDSTSFSRDNLTVEVFQKGTSASTPTCYCFGFNRKNIIDDIAQNGKSIIQEEIKQYVKDKKCACEIRNPQGSCCLGNINQVIKEMAST